MLTGEALAEIEPGTWCIRSRGFASNTYLCRLAGSDSCLVVDPGVDIDGIEMALGTLELVPQAIYCTHGHFDHLGSAAKLQERYGIRLHLHRDDVQIARSARFNMMMYGVEGIIVTPSLDVLVEDGSRFLAGPDEVRFMHTPGHTPGSCCVFFRDLVFTGDTLYCDGVGKTTSQAARALLHASLEKLSESVRGASLICPGHGATGTFSTIKQENRAFRAALGLSDPDEDG